MGSSQFNKIFNDTLGIYNGSQAKLSWTRYIIPIFLTLISAYILFDIKIIAIVNITKSTFDPMIKILTPFLSIIKYLSMICAVIVGFIIIRNTINIFLAVIFTPLFIAIVVNITIIIIPIIIKLFHIIYQKSNNLLDLVVYKDRFINLSIIKTFYYFIYFAFIVSIIIYIIIRLRESCVYSDKQGIWYYHRSFPWKILKTGIYWSDLDYIEFKSNFFSWIGNSYTLVLHNKYNNKIIKVSGVWNGNKYIYKLNREFRNYTFIEMVKNKK